MILEFNVVDTDLISLMVLGVAIIALVVSVIVLCVSVYFNRKSLSASADVLNVSKQQFRQFEYFEVIDIVKNSKHGHDVFSKLHIFFESYTGVWIDEKIKKYVNDKSKEIEDFEKNSEFSRHISEPEQREYTDDEIDEFHMEQQEEIANMSQDERYDYEFDQKFRNVKDELLKLLYDDLKKTIKKINKNKL